MKRKMMALLCVLCMTAGCFAGCENDAYVDFNGELHEAHKGDSEKLQAKNVGKKHYSVEEKTLPMYLGTAEDKQDYNVYFVDDGDVPYISAADMGELLRFLGTDEDDSISLNYDYKTKDDHVIYARDGGAYTMDLDFTNDTITFADYDAFFQNEGKALVDLVEYNAGTEMLFKKSDKSTDRYGKILVFDLKPYEIDLVKSGDGYYVPLQTISDLIASHFICSLLYNGDALFVSAGGFDEKLDQIFRSGSLEWSKEYAEFNYHALCCSLDYQYGLKEIHGIESFDDLFMETGLKDEFLSTDPTVADQALYKLIYFYIGDIHSEVSDISFMSDDKKWKEVEKLGKGLARTNLAESREMLLAAREAIYPDGISAYEEVGNTAYITFDSFNHPGESTDYLAAPTQEDNTMDDTIRLMQYAYSQILRENSPIENVVLDLSINTGGWTTAAEYVLAAFLGEADFCTKNMMTGAVSDAIYTIDINLDGKFDEQDTLYGKGLNLYCLESPVSFSCGNLVPCVFKGTQKVTLLGKTSGGGSCSVYNLSTAGGSQFTISGYRRFSAMKNGSFYDIDTGAEPDYYISNPKKFYDRQALTQYINGLY